MEKVSKTFKKFKKELILGPLFKSVEVVGELLIPFVMKYILNEGLDNFKNSSDIGYILYPGLIILGICIVSFFSTLVAQYMASVAGPGIGNDLRNRIYEKIMKISHEDKNKFRKGYLVNLISSDSFNIQQASAMFIRLVFRAPVLVIGSLVCAFIINVKYGLICLIILPIAVAILALFLVVHGKQYIKIQNSLDNLSVSTSDFIKGQRTIRAFNKQSDAEEKFSIKSNDYYSNVRRSNFISALISPLTFLIINVGISIIVYFSKDAAINNEITSGDIAAIISYLTQILMALIVISDLTVIYSKAFVSNKRINNFLTSEVGVSSNGNLKNVEINDNENLLFFNNVSFKFKDNSKNTLENIEFSIKKGEKVGIIGSTGSGKSTFLKLILRFVEPTDGEIIYKGNKIEDYDLKYLRENISTCSQNVSLLNGSIKDNLLLGNKNHTEVEIVKALKEAKCDFVFDYDDFIDHKILDNGNNLSGGQKQRLSIARALLKDSDLFILDDSTSALDYLTEKEIRENLNKRGVSLIYISQRTSCLKDCDKIYVFDNGKIESVGKHDELLKISNIYKEITELQARVE
ncbi:MAG: ABC transporter ATP-binding protein [Bacilli bacterium]|nr:ABC transporter ATP-binding protein [Bacilli bacterium]